MTINRNRIFRGNDGKSYRVQNTTKKDIENGGKKYYLTVLENGFYKVCCDLFYECLYFDTIKDAQREVMFYADMITTL